LQNGNRFQIPTLVRWRYKLEVSQPLNVEVHILGLMGVREKFLTKMRKDGRVTIPALNIAMLKQNAPDLKGYAMEILFNPDDLNLFFICCHY